MAGGGEHTLILTNDGKLFSCGSGYKDSRRVGLPPVLGHGSVERQLLPQVCMSGLDSALGAKSCFLRSL